MYKVVDLFAGAGGLSLGFMQTQKYDIKVAFENYINSMVTGYFAGKAPVYDVEKVSDPTKLNIILSPLILYLYNF